MNREEMINAIKRIAVEKNLESVPRHMFLRITKVSERQIGKCFGSYNGLVEAAGLKTVRFPTSDQPKYTDEEMIDEILRVIRLPNSKMTRIYFDQNAGMSSTACERRFGGWLNALRIVQKKLNQENEKELFLRLEEYIAPNNHADRGSRKSASQFFSQAVVDSPPPEKDDQQESEIDCKAQRSISSNIYGDFINFRGLQHAPVNEQGVVFLFGMICREIGYVVEIVRSGFPDCEAKREMPGQKGKWQRVRIEFEFLSRSFRSHGHDPDFCDLIICWENNWPECPIEVLELKTVIQRLFLSV